MSRPATREEREQEQATLMRAGPADNVVSTACPACGTRFAMLARYDLAGWYLRCTSCGWSGTGELKT